MAPLTETEAEQFSAYLELFLRWNERINLSAIRDAESILSRHFLESILCARALPAPIATLLDYGSGGGLPGVPIAILNPEVHVTLAESQSKKAAFLSEVVRALSLNAKVHSSRAELLQTKFDCVTLRAVDKMAEAVQSASTLVALNGWLVLMTTSTDSSALTTAAGDLYEWSTPQSLPGADLRIILIGQKSKP
jgi:16S rRNA (guanine527-N7)-methyltransferase